MKFGNDSTASRANFTFCILWGIQFHRAHDASTRKTCINAYMKHMHLFVSEIDHYWRSGVPPPKKNIPIYSSKLLGHSRKTTIIKNPSVSSLLNNLLIHNQFNFTTPKDCCKSWPIKIHRALNAKKREIDKNCHTQSPTAGITKQNHMTEEKPE